MVEIKCNSCGKMFEARSNRQIYCSKTCRNRFVFYNNEVARVGTEETCKICGGKFIRKHPKQIYCSQNCRRISCRIRRGYAKPALDDSKAVRKPTDRKFNVNKCMKCQFSVGVGGSCICNYAEITGNTCLRRADNGKVFDIRGEEYNNCLKYVKGKRKRMEGVNEQG